MQRRCLWGFLVLAGILRVLMIFEIPFTDTTEARYAEIARKMVETGDWITPQFDYGVPFWGKPPLHTWVSAA
ncbi:MAG TPA: dolichyl-phosphate-mannose--protein mannosyltransferase, partial [Opitutae bacterium]|nr:dolichyl-phosphate-mannose--protein mannosyltransferase [Opitutae bacterium]